MEILYNYRFRDNVKYGTRHPKYYIYSTHEVKCIVNSLPSKIDLTNLIKNIYDQDIIKSSTSITTNSLLKMLLQQNKKSWFSSKNVEPSILYNYNISRMYEESKLSDDDNCMIETSLMVLKEYKYCDENVFKYNIYNKYMYPSLECYSNAKLCTLKFNYEKLTQDLKTIKMYLNNGFPVIIGIVLFESLYNSVNGLLLTPNVNSEKVLGSHVILLIGYDDDKRTFKFLNNLGPNWGNNGFGYIMYDYVMNEEIAGDIYTLKIV